MSTWLLAVVMIVVVNPFRMRLGLPDRPPAVTALGVLAAIGGVAGLAAAADPVLRALEISPETYLIAAGVVAILAAGRTLFFPVPYPEPPLPGARAALWPIAYPGFLAAEVVAIALALPGQRGVMATTLAAAAAGTAVVALSWWRPGDIGRRLLVAGARLAAVVLAVAGVWMMIEGIRDV